MSLHVEGQDCPVCHGHLFDDDDVVFCPVCGAPHHRDCYKSVGHCALEEFHGTDKEYRRPEPEDHHESENNGADSEQVCRNCGTHLRPENLFCPNCGHSTGKENGRPPFAGGAAGERFVIDPLGGVPSDKKIEDIPVVDIARHVAVGTNRYIPLFGRLSKKKRINWNWAAFLFPTGWLWYRKCYKQGIIFLALTVAAALLALPYQEVLEQLMLNTEYATSAQIMNELLQNPELLSGYVMLTCMISGFINLASRIVCGMFGDYIYRCSTLEKIRRIKETSESDDEYAGLLAAKGGVSLFGLMIALAATSWLPVLLSVFVLG